ncbi:O-antigen ligase family protein [Algoriphagus chordae]|uniref:O-antigen ligase-like membrane protein n=1 Tax=Algoriphagus chordae TaxID=237019 RepID=A0A2W7QGT8_9BACT|nr:O-antigen ligase family protein [Algoriphagus chordae]PZX47674.1 O-antigen ligase-like membrane protein [Algoriphagus chordae]
MIKYLILNKRPYIWILIHLLLGLSATVTPYGIIAWFYLVLITSLTLVMKKGKSPYLGMTLILYLISFELLSRMAFTSPFIPYELGKYLLAVGMIWGIIQYKTHGYLGWIMLLCMIPALFFDLSGEVQKSDLIFNMLGPINVALVVIFFYKQRITQVQLGNMLRMMVYPILGVLSYTFVKTPDFSEVEFVLGANVDMSGGFGSNQVSTLFGLAALFMFFIMINRWKFSGNYIVDGLILFAFTFQGLLTFSRGGMIGTALGAIVVLFFLRLASAKEKRLYRLPKIGKFVIPAMLITILAFVVVDQITNGMLSLRYQGETIGTIEGSKVKSMYTVTTGRLDIFLGDVDLWLEHFIFGVGAGASRFLREGLHGTVAHVELSRLLAEHGALGLVYFLILCWLGLHLLKSHPNPLIKGLLIALFLVALYTSFHAAMRTYVTPALVGLSLLSISNPKPKRANPVSRKQAKKPRLQPHLH